MVSLRKNWELRGDVAMLTDRYLIQLGGRMFSRRER
jgi:hypothetical protein